jgi:hypothetical protein
MCTTYRILLLIGVFFYCPLFAQSETPVSVTWWNPEIAGSVSLGANGNFTRVSEGGLILSLSQKLGKLPYPIRLTIQPAMNFTTRLQAKSDFEFSGLKISKDSLSELQMDWSYLELQIPLDEDFFRQGLRPGAYRLGFEWHFTEFSLRPPTGSSLLNVDRSINAITLELEWRKNLSKSRWTFSLKPKGVWMQDLGGSPSTHLEGELGLSYAKSSWQAFLGFKRKKTRLFPSQRLSASTLPNADFIFILDGPVIRVSKAF